MAQVIAPEVWQEGIDDNRLLPGRVTAGLFQGSLAPNAKIANNGGALRVWDMAITDYITDYDDRRLNGLAGTNTEGRDGWGASAYGVFQDVRFDSRVYTMSRHRSVAFRIFDEQQYSGGIGAWGDATHSNVITPGQSLMNTAAILNKTKTLWQESVLNPDIDRYNIFCAVNGHMNGRWVQDNPSEIFNDEGQWVATPGTTQGNAIEPSFAAIHAVEWDNDNIPLLLKNIDVVWSSLRIPQDSRCLMLDPFYEYDFMAALTGKGIVATDSAFNMLQDGHVTKLMGWELSFDIPSEYWPHIYVDDNLNVVHSKDGKAPYDKYINSVAYTDTGRELLLSMAASDRMTRPNFIRTEWDNDTKSFKKVLTNYPLGMPSAAPYFGDPVKLDPADFGKPTDYPFTAPGAGYGLKTTTGPQGTIKRRQTIGMFLYKKAVQTSQEYSSMVTDTGMTRGKFTEMCFDVKYDCWVIESLSQGIIPIIDAVENTGTFAIPVQVIEPDTSDAKVLRVTADPATLSLKVGQEAYVNVKVEGTGAFDKGWSAFSSDATKAEVMPDGKVRGIAAGTATITFRSLGDPAKTDTVTVNVSANPGA